MAFCKYCGCELDAEGKCTCREFVEENSDEVSEEVKPIHRGGLRSIFALVMAIVIVIAVIALIIIIMIGMGSYKKPVKELTKGINRAKAEKVIDSYCTETMTAELRVRARDNNTKWKSFLESYDDYLDDMLEAKDIKKLKVKVVAKEKISGSNFDKIVRYYDMTHGMDVKKAYRVEVEFTVKKRGEKEVRSGWLCVVKLKDEGWKFCPEYSTDHFDFIDAALNYR